MEGLRILLLAGVIGTMMGGALYAGVRAERMRASRAAPDEPAVPSPARAEDRPSPGLEPEADGSPEPEAEPMPTAAFDPVLDVGIRLDEEADLTPVPDDIVLASGVRIGRAMFGADPEAEEASEPETAPAPRSRRARRAPRRPPGPRLHPDPGMHSVLTARRMIANGERIRGSCYAYLSEVYERAGHRSWRKRRIVYRAERDGPYADLNQIRPGDWLYIVNDPHRTPVGTHSVMFVRWTDRARGYASVISHPGWGAPHAGAERTYDISRTYRIIRPTL